MISGLNHIILENIETEVHDDGYHIAVITDKVPVSKLKEMIANKKPLFATIELATLKLFVSDILNFVITPSNKGIFTTTFVSAGVPAMINIYIEDGNTYLTIAVSG